MWAPTTRATSVTLDTAVGSLSAATTTMNSGVSPCLLLLGPWGPGYASARRKAMDWAALFSSSWGQCWQVESVPRFQR